MNCNDRVKENLSKAGLTNFTHFEVNGISHGQEEIDFLRLVGYREKSTNASNDDGTISPKLRLDLVEFELRHLKVSLLTMG